MHVIEDPSTLKECKIISADISNMYPSLPIAMMIQVSHVVIDEAFRRAALTLGLKLKYEHIRDICGNNFALFQSRWIFNYIHSLETTRDFSTDIFLYV